VPGWVLLASGFLPILYFVLEKTSARLVASLIWQVLQARVAAWDVSERAHCAQVRAYTGIGLNGPGLLAKACTFSCLPYLFLQLCAWQPMDLFFFRFHFFVPIYHFQLEWFALICSSGQRASYVSTHPVPSIHF
jgi:hypothetical protein